MVTLGWPWPIFCQGQIWSLGFWMEKRWNIIFFQNNVWYERRCFMHTCEYQSPRSFSDLGQRSLGFSVLTFSTDFSSETPEPVSFKFHIQRPGNGRLKICSNDPGVMAKMVTIPIYGKNLKNSLFQNCWVTCLETWYVAWEYYQVRSNGDLGSPWPIFHQGQIWSLGLLNGEKVKHCIFGKQWYSVIRSTSVNTKGQGYSVTLA